MTFLHCSFKAQPSCRDERVARVLPDPDPLRQEVPVAVEADEPEVRGVRDGVGQPEVQIPLHRGAMERRPHQPLLLPVSGIWLFVPLCQWPAD